MELFHVIDNMQFLHYLPALLTSKEYQPKRHLHFPLMPLDPNSPSFRTLFFNVYENMKRKLLPSLRQQERRSKSKKLWLAGSEAGAVVCIAVPPGLCVYHK